MAWVLVVVVALMVPLSVLAVWAVQTVTNTDQFVATVGPLARQDVITDAVAARATNTLFDKVDVQHRISSALPKRASPLAAPLTGQLHSFVYDELRDVLRSDKFQEIWNGAVRHSHSAVVGVLTGKPPPGLKRINQAALNLAPVLTNAIDQLDKKGIHYFDGIKRSVQKGHDLQVELLNSKQIANAQGLFAFITDLRWYIPGATLGLLVIALAVAVDRRKTLLRMAAGAALITVVVMCALAYSRNYFVTVAEIRHVQEQVSGTVFTTVVRYLKDAMIISLVVEIVVALLAYLAGPGRLPVWLRRTTGHGIKTGAAWLSDLARTRGPELTGGARNVARWVVDNQSALRLGGAIVAVLVALFFSGYTVTGFLVIAVLFLAYLAALQLVVGWSRRAMVRAPGDSPAEPSSSGHRPPGPVPP